MSVGASSSSPGNAASEFRQAIGECFPSHNFDEPLLCTRSKGVWGSTTSDLVVKVKRLAPGKGARREYDEQRRLCELLGSYDSTGALRRRATIPTPLDFVVSERRQVYFVVMERLYPATPGSFAALPRMYLGCRNHHQNVRSPRAFARDTPDNYLSYADVDHIVSAYPRIHAGWTNLELICHDLGTLLALIHFGAKRDGRNLEVVVARRRRVAPDYTLALLDFDKIESLEALFTRRDEDAIVRALSSKIAKEYYCPFPTTGGFQPFRQGYLTCAEELDRREGGVLYRALAVRVVRKHVTRWLRRSMLKLFAIERAGAISGDRRRAYQRFVRDRRNIDALQSFLHDRSYHVVEQDILSFVEDQPHATNRRTLDKSTDGP